MREFVLAVIIWSVILFSGCVSYHVFPREDRDPPLLETRQSAFVKNPQLEQELKILQASNLYTFTDSTSADVTVRLDTMDTYPDDVEGSVVLGMTITLGLAPVYFADRYIYSYSKRIRKTGKVERDTFLLKVAQRTWALNAFLNAESKESKLGEALRAKVVNEEVAED